MSDTTAAGWVLIVGSSLFLTGAGLPPEPRRVFSAPLREHLEILNRHASRWRAMNWLMIAGVVGTSIGLALLAAVLAPPGEEWRALAATSAYVIGGVLWISSLAFRNTATLHAARTSAATGEIPAWLEPLGEWTGQMFRVYMVLAYATIAVFGWSILTTDVVSHGVGWFGVAFGAVLGVSFVTRFPRTSFGSIADIPALIHIATLVFGIALL